jgi:hypothetical protein
MVSLAGPAFMTFVASVILGLVLLLPIDLTIYDHETNKVVVDKYNAQKRITMLLFLSIPLAIHIYSIQCMVAGKCMVWSWIVSALLTGYIIAFILLSLKLVS